MFLSEKLVKTDPRENCIETKLKFGNERKGINYF